MLVECWAVLPEDVVLKGQVPVLLEAVDGEVDEALSGEPWGELDQVLGLDRPPVVLSLKEHLGLAREEGAVSGQHSVEVVRYVGVRGVEPVWSAVEDELIVLKRARQPADDGQLLDDHDLGARLGEQMRGHEACDACSDDDYWSVINADLRLTHPKPHWSLSVHTTCTRLPHDETELEGKHVCQMEP